MPVDIAPKVNTLPRCLNESEIVTIKFKRKIQYKRCEFKENIRPMAVWKALIYLLKESPLYKEANIQVNTRWLDNMYNLIDDDRELVTEHIMKMILRFKTRMNRIMMRIKYMVLKKKQFVIKPDEDECEQNGMSDDEGISFTEENEDNLETFAIDMDTMTDDYDPIIPQSDEPLVPEQLTFAPGEGQVPLSVFQDDNAEYLAFPTIYCGQKRPDNSERVHKVHYSDICKYELRCVDRRVASNIPNMFFKQKRLQTKQVCDKVTLALQ